MKYTQTFKEALQQVREDGHTDVASAVRQCKTTIEDASQMLSKLQGMNPEDNLPSWWMNKIAIAANSMNKLRDYLLVPSTNEAKEEVEKEVPKEKDSSGEIENLKSQIQALKQQLENEKNKAVKPEPNPETGEVPLRTGLAQALLDKSTPPPDIKSLDKKKLKMSLGKTKIEVNPDVQIGVFSGGKETPSGNLH
jgi:pyruvate dehydrogenase complex dehydrogenase (E1) component